MAAKDLNIATTAKLKYMHAGEVVVDDGTDTHTIGFVIPESIQVTRGGASVTPERSLSALTGKGRRGLDQPSSLSFQLNPNTDGWIKDAVADDDIIGVLDPDSRSGKLASVTTYTVEVNVYSDAAQTTGLKMTLTSCYLNGPITYSGSGEGSDGDLMNISLISLSDEIVVTAISP